MALFGLIPSGKSATLRLTPEQVEKEATGRALMMIGGTISIIGGSMVFSVNPAVRQEAQGVWKRLPPAAQRNKALTVVGVGIGVALLSSWAMRSKIGKRFDFV